MRSLLLLWPHDQTSLRTPNTPQGWLGFDEMNVKPELGESETQSCWNRKSRCGEPFPFDSSCNMIRPLIHESSTVMRVVPPATAPIASGCVTSLGSRPMSPRFQMFTPCNSVSSDFCAMSAVDVSCRSEP